MVAKNKELDLADSELKDAIDQITELTEAVEEKDLLLRKLEVGFF